MNCAAQQVLAFSGGCALSYLMGRLVEWLAKRG
jgi:hypothetical protein